MAVAPGGNLIDGGVAHVGDVIAVAPAEVVGLEGQDGVEGIDVAADGLDAAFFPRPNLRGYIIMYGADAAALYVAGYLEVEAGVVDEDEHVGAPRLNLLLTALHAAQDGAQVQQDGDEAHVGQVAVVAQQLGAGLCHGVAAVALKAGLGVEFAQGAYQRGAVKVAAGLAGYEEIAHRGWGMKFLIRMV